MTERPDPLAPPEGYGRQRNIAAGYTEYEPDENCWMDNRQCQRPVVAVITLGDLQEHVIRMNTCEVHLSLSRACNHECTVCRDARPRPGVRKADPKLRILKIERLDGRPASYDPGTEAAIEWVFTQGDK